MSAITKSIPASRLWPLTGDVQIDQNHPRMQASIRLNEGLELANAQLKPRGLEVRFLEHVPRDPLVEGIDPSRNLLLAIRSKEGQGPLDIIDLKALDEKSLKPAAILGEEIAAKVDQHLLARKTNGILFTSSGSKLDGRGLKGYQISIDAEGYLRVDAKRVFISGNRPYNILKAEQLRSYTILRFVNDIDNTIRIFDEYDLVRLNNQSMFIDPTVVLNLGIHEIAPSHQKLSLGFKEGYFELQRDKLSIEKKQELLLQLEDLMIK